MSCAALRSLYLVASPSERVRPRHYIGTTGSVNRFKGVPTEDTQAIHKKSDFRFLVVSLYPLQSLEYSKPVVRSYLPHLRIGLHQGLGAVPEELDPNLQTGSPPGNLKDLSLAENWVRDNIPCLQVLLDLLCC